MTYDYLLYRISGKSIFALPRTLVLRRAALRRYQPMTLKRAIYRLFLYLCMSVGADRLVSTPAVSPLPDQVDFGFEGWMKKMRSCLGTINLCAAVFFQSQEDRQRIYVHLFDGIQPIGFAKITKDDCCAGLQREAATLHELCTQNLRHCRIPRCIVYGGIDGYAYLVMEPLPLSVRPVKSSLTAYPLPCVKEYAGAPRLVTAEQVLRLSWWTRYQTQTDECSAAFDTELTSLLIQVEQGIKVCRAHGDLGVANMVYENRMPWIFDWEESYPDAPHCTDPLSYEMAINYRAFLANPDRGIRSFRQRHLFNTTVSQRLDIMLALAYRHMIGVEDATHIIYRWNDWDKG